MAYSNYQELFNDIGFVWDHSQEDLNSLQQNLQSIHNQFMISEQIHKEKEQNQIIEELLEVTSQIIQKPINSSIQQNNNGKEEEIGSISISKRKRSFDSDISTKRKHPEDEIDKTWNDVVGQEDAKRALFECCILPSILPSYLFVGLRQLCMTILLYGPPGTGKTTLVHVVANESQNHLIELIPSSCLSKWAGEAERKIKDVFQEAKQRAPSIIFLDEFDALALRRETTEDIGSRRVLSELLIQLSSIQSTDRVTVIAATNRISDLDPAIIRRFQKTIEVPLPSLEEREQLIQKGLTGISNRLSNEEIHYLAESTPGWSGSLLSNLCREAVMLPVLEISQVLLSSTQNTPFDMSISSSRSFTPVSSEGGDVSIERTKGKGIEVRPVVFNDFLDALTALQNRVSIETNHDFTNSSSLVSFHQFYSIHVSLCLILCLSPIKSYYSLK